MSARRTCSGVPGDLEDHDGDREADDRVGDLGAERDHDGARDDGERDEAVDAGMISVGGHSGASEPPARRQAHPRSELVAHEPDKPGCGEYPQVRQVLWVDEPLDRHVERDAGGDEDRENDREPGSARRERCAERTRSRAGSRSRHRRSCGRGRPAARPSVRARRSRVARRRRSRGSQGSQRPP